MLALNKCILVYDYFTVSSHYPPKCIIPGQIYLECALACDATCKTSNPNLH